MRVLHILQYSLPAASGYTVRSAYIMAGQKSLGITPFGVTSARHPNPVDQTEQIQGISIRRTPAYNGTTLPLVRELNLMRALHKTIKQAVRVWQPDIIHAHSPMLVGLPSLVAAKQHGLPLVYEVRDLWENAAVASGTFTETSIQYSLARSADSLLFRKANAIVTICSAMRDHIASRTANSIQPSVVPNGVMLDNFTPKPPQPDLLERFQVQGKRLFGFLGSFEPWEGLDVLIAAVPKIVAAVPHAHLLISGSGRMEQAVKEQITSLGLEAHITLTGRIEHASVNDVLALNELMIYPRSRSQITELTTPIKPLEAMAMARPIVVSDVGGLLELIEPGKTGLSFSAGDSSDLAHRVIDLLNDTHQQQVIGNAARTQVVADRDWPSITEQYRTIYDEAIQHHQSKSKSHSMQARQKA